MTLSRLNILPWSQWFKTHSTVPHLYCGIKPEIPLLSPSASAAHLEVCVYIIGSQFVWSYVLASGSIHSISGNHIQGFYSAAPAGGFSSLCASTLIRRSLRPVMWDFVKYCWVWSYKHKMEARPQRIMGRLCRDVAESGQWGSPGDVTITSYQYQP